jgi:hypothetical protein
MSNTIEITSDLAWQIEACFARWDNGHGYRRSGPEVVVRQQLRDAINPGAREFRAMIARTVLDANTGGEA